MKVLCLTLASAAFLTASSVIPAGAVIPAGIGQANVVLPIARNCEPCRGGVCREVCHWERDVPRSPRDDASRADPSFGKQREVPYPRPPGNQYTGKPTHER